ncbi:MAG: hypothetical protein V2B19_15130 [Pseudomonadota bacterium]
MELIVDIEEKNITGDALLTRKDIGEYLVSKHRHYHLTVKKNQPGVFKDISLYFENRGEPDYLDYGACEHGRIEVGAKNFSTLLDHDRTQWLSELPGRRAGVCHRAGIRGFPARVISNRLLK